jgi:hypothetical protein
MKLNHAEKGQSLVELALTLIIILTLLAGAVDLGSAFFSYVAIRDAAQEGALYGSIFPTGAIESRVRGASGPPSPPSPTKPKPVDLYDLTKVTVSVSAIPPCSGGEVIVTVKYTYTLIMPLISAIIGPTITLTASAKDTILQPSSCP